VRRYKKTPSTTSPKDDRRACLCPDGTYSRECCDGSLIAQGIGNITGTAVTSEGLTISGLSISSAGVITLPTATFQGTSFGTVGSVTPPSFEPVSTETTRTVTANVTVPAGFTNTGNIVTKDDTATQPANTSVALSCDDIGITGFAVSQTGVITLPSIDKGTIASTSPSSFSSVSTDTTRTLTVNITVPSGYTNSGATLACTTTATQSAGVTNPIQSTIHRYYHTGVPTGIVTYRMAINPDGTFAEFAGIRGAVVGGAGFLGYSEPEVVSGSSTGLSFSATNIGGTTVGLGYNNGANFPYFSATEFTSLQTGSSTNPITNLPFINNNDGNVSSPTPFGFFDSVNSIGIRFVDGGLMFNSAAPLSSQGNLNQAMPDGYYTRFNLNNQIRIENGFITEVKTIV
tara:strand:- start:61 stop:1263 length:1203 start_codon:yes stop_codon:yes gene_type:complete